MPKIKSSRGATKRFSKTKTGKWKHKRINVSHLLTHKNRNRKRTLHRPAFISKTERMKLNRLLPYA